MNLKLKKISKLSPSANRLLIARKDSDLTSFNISEEDANYIKAKFDKDQKLVTLNQGGKHLYIQLINEKENINQTKEQLRKAANKAHGLICDNNVEDITIEGDTDKKEILLAYAEGLALSNYQFLKYFSDPDKKKYSLKTVSVFNKEVKAKDLELLSIICESVYIARDLVNEPLSYLTAEKLADEAKALSKKAKIKTTIYDKKKIESFGMGGLLAVNKGSIDPPTFTVMEWKPKNAINKQPLALVGKGVVFDTGGLSLKPTADSMDYMKSDMAGAAAVIATIYAVAKAELPVHVIAFIPATDNRPDGNAYAPGDVIKMFNGKTVEVLNTDAEGRMILADALSYSEKYKPELTIDVATLTGAASAAIGPMGIAAMGNAPDTFFDIMKKSGENVYERIAIFPFWDEYSEMLKSDIADLKNIGGKKAGAITAGKFLENFTQYPFIHLDIASMAYMKSADSYRGKNGSGIPVRLLFDFISSLSLTK